MCSAAAHPLCGQSKRALILFIFFCFYKMTGKNVWVGRCMQQPLCGESRRALILMRMDITSSGAAPSAPRCDGKLDKEM